MYKNIDDFNLYKIFFDDQQTVCDVCSWNIYVFAYKFPPPLPIPTWTLLHSDYQDFAKRQLESTIYNLYK